LILEPGILIITITIDLTEFELIKIGALIVVTKDGASAPIGMTPAIFILQAVP